jgi:hypothetical protein
VPPGGGHVAGTVDKLRYVVERRLRCTPYYLNIAEYGPIFVHGKIEIPATDINPDGSLANCLFGMFAYRGTVEQMIEELRCCADTWEFIKRPSFKLTAEDKVSIGDILTGAEAPQDIEHAGGAGVRNAG